MKFRSFKTKIMIEILMMAVVIMVISMLIIVPKIRMNREEQVLDANLSVAVALQKSFDTHLLDLKKYMEVLASAEEVRTFDLDTMDSFLKEAVNLHTSISQIYVMDASGWQIYKTSYPETLGDRSDREYFQHAIKGEPFISDVIVSRSTGEPIATVAVPIYNQGEIIGVLGASIEFARIAESINALKLMEHAYVYVVDRVGRIIVHPNQDFVDDMLDVSYLEPVKAVIAGDTGIGKYIFEGSEKLVSYAQAKESGWGILVAVSTEWAFAKVNETVRWFLAIFATTLIAFFIWSYVVSMHIMRPVDEMVQALNGIGRREYDVKFKLHRDDEFGLIQQAITELSDEVKSSYETLEEKVAERTLDLNKAKIRLEEYIERLEDTRIQLGRSNAELETTVKELQEAHKKIADKNLEE